MALSGSQPGSVDRVVVGAGEGRGGEAGAEDAGVVAGAAGDEAADDVGDGAGMAGGETFAVGENDGHGGAW